MDLTEANIQDVVKTFKNINMKNTSLCLSEEAPLGICLMNPDYFIISNKLQPPYGYEFLERGYCIEGRILAAKDFSYGKFRAPGEAEYEDIRCHNFYGRNADSQAVGLKRVLSLLPSATEQINISEMFDSGDYEIAGRNLAKIDIRNPQVDFSFKNKEAETLVFSVGKPRKLFTIEINMMRGLRDLGFDFEGYVVEGVNAPIILIKSEVLDAVGVLSETPESGIRTTDDGRSISEDAIVTSWWSEQRALEVIGKEEYFFSYRYKYRGLTCVDDIVNERISPIARAASALRWQGYPDHQIMKIVKEREYEAWLDMHSHILSRAKARLDEALSGSANVPYIKNQAKQLCGEFERLQEMMNRSGNPEKLDYGHLKELVKVVSEI